MKTREQTFAAIDGLQLFYREWLPDAEARAVVAVIHGYGDHSGRYGDLAAHLTGGGYAVCAYDLRGHGRSHGPRGYVAHFSDYVEDTRTFLDLVHERLPRKRVILFGHSLGGLVALNYAEENPGEVPALVLSSPFLKMRLKIPGWRMRFVRVAAAVTPSSPIANPLSGEMLSRDPEQAAAYDADPLVHHVATAGWAGEVLQAQARAQQCAQAVSCPLLVIYSADDPIADPAATDQFGVAATIQDKTVLRYEGYRHETFNDLGKEVVLGELDAWLRTHAVRRVRV
jgi:acylglycerol lipase